MLSKNIIYNLEILNPSLEFHYEENWFFPFQIKSLTQEGYTFPFKLEFNPFRSLIQTLILDPSKLLLVADKFAW